MRGGSRGILTTDSHDIASQAIRNNNLPNAPACGCSWRAGRQAGLRKLRVVVASISVKGAVGHRAGASDRRSCVGRLSTNIDSPRPRLRSFTIYRTVSHRSPSRSRLSAALLMVAQAGWPRGDQRHPPAGGSGAWRAPVLSVEAAGPFKVSLSPL